MKRFLLIAGLAGIVTAFGIPGIRNADFWNAAVRGYLLFSEGRNAEAGRAFESGTPASGVEKRTYLRFAGSVAKSEAGSGSDAIGAISDASFSGNARMESVRLYDLGNAYARDALSLSGIARKQSLEAALRTYERSFEVRWMPEAENNYWEVKRFLEREFPPEPLPGISPSKPETGSGSESPKNGSGADSGSGASEKTEKEPETEKSGDEERPEKSDPSRTEKNGPGKAGTDGSPEAPDKDEGADDPSATTPREGGTAEDRLKPESGNWSNAGDLRRVGGGGAGIGTGLTDAERRELEWNLDAARELQKRQNEFVRPDGKPGESAGAGTVLPGEFREFFRGDPLFERFFGTPSEESGKTW